MEGPIDRLTAAPEVAAAFEALTAELSGSDLTSLLLEVMRARVTALSPADVMRARGSSRFVAPATVTLTQMRRAEDALLGVILDRFEGVLLAPVVPFGTHHTLGAVDQNNVVSAVRSLEVAADPTNGLAIEAALRRRDLLAQDPRSAERVRLAAAQQVTRAQVFEGPVSFAHFTIVGLVTAGRDAGSFDFERSVLVEHVATQVDALRACGADDVRVLLSDLSGRHPDLVTVVSGAVDATVEAAPRTSSYYREVAFTVRARIGGEEFEVGDGGIVDWTARLLGNAKERLMTSGIGVDRVAIGMSVG